MSDVTEGVVEQKPPRAEIHVPCFIAVLCGGLPLVAIGADAFGWPLTGIGILWFLTFVYLRARATSHSFRRVLAYFLKEHRRVLIVWAIFEVTFTLLPIGVGYLLRVMGEADTHPVRHGDLLLVAAVLCFVGVAYLVRIPGATQRRGSAVGVIIGTIIVAMIDVAGYNVVAAVDHPPNAGLNALSLALYALSACLTLACTLVAESGKITVADNMGSDAG
jgi:hypothetical protein